MAKIEVLPVKAFARLKKVSILFIFHPSSQTPILLYRMLKRALSVRGEASLDFSLREKAPR
uniref:Uncharacterized protein n=1 Tax=Candidatus Kentrum sp. LFY TaxID=2126342 RepID=A0A450U4W0_9GAMM|nr:MAG: hypothetical protein BECKLFY1418B_GA0070995_100151 [Candidatus Kentron sp. LFY]VFJ97911.1 MAG: hypothetical protein BECKLFY1418A_GA0070994_10757 [Candidatus Kentron sp. LFY]